MNFLNPWAFLFLLTVPVLVLLYFLKLRRPQIRVPSTLLWRKVVEDMRVNAPFQRLRRSLLLLLQLLALLAAIAALARPILKVRETARESLIVLLDNSASMSALEDSRQTRLQIARAQIAKIADNLAGGDEAMLIAFNASAGVACGFTANPRLLREAVAGVRPTDCATDVEPALLLAKSICNSRSHPRILLFSDGAFGETRNLELPVDVEYQKIGSARPNLAITGLDIRRALEDRTRIEMFAAVENFSTQAFAGTMTVTLDGTALDTKYFSVGPQEALSQIFEASLPEGGTVQVQLDAADALACDNTAWKVVDPPTRRRVWVVGENTFFIERVLKSSPGVEYRLMTEAEYDERGAGEASAVIWNNVAKPRPTPGDAIYLGCFPAAEGLAPGAKVDAPDVLDWDNAHPLNRFIDYDNLIIQSATAVALPPSAATVLRSSTTPLIGAFETGGRLACVVGFDPMRSNWPLLVSFPLFLNNALNYFEEAQRRRAERNIPVGRSLTVRGAAAAPSLSLPDGRRERLRKNPGGEYSWADVSRCGVYGVDLGGGSGYRVAANLFNRRESQLDVVAEPAVGGKKARALHAARETNREFWRIGAMILAGALLIEWLVYHRRWFV